MQVDAIYLVLPGNQIPSQLSDLDASMKLTPKQGNRDILFVKYICSAHAVVYIEDIYFFWVNTTYVSLSAVKKSVFFTSAQHESKY